jgi:predicted permease
MPIWRRHGILGLFRLLADIAVRIPAEHFAELKRDLRYGLRTLGRSPGFATVAIISVSLAIFAGTVFFSELNATILRNVPVVEHPNELIILRQPISYPTYKRFITRRDLFSSTAAYVAPVPFGISLGGSDERIWGHLVTPSYFLTLGVHAALGRVFDDRDQEGGEAPPVIVSYRFWQNQLGSDPAIVSKVLRINGHPCTIVGVGPKDFLGASPMMFAADLWMPLSVGGQVAPELADGALGRPQVAIFQMTGRMKPGITVERVEAELDTSLRQMLKDYGSPGADEQGRLIQAASGGKLVPTREKNPVSVALLPTLVITLILLIACSNVANMMLARAMDRRREIAVRLSLGASRARLVRQLLTESMMIAAGAGTVGFILAAWATHLMSRLQLPHAMPVDFNVEVDWHVLLFTMALTVLTGLAFGLVPALQSTKPELTSALKEGGNVVLRKYRRFGMRNLLVTFQMAGSLMLLLLTGYIVIGVEKTMSTTVGFSPKNIQLISVDPTRDGYSAAQSATFYPKLMDRVRVLPGVVSATWTEAIPMHPSGNVAFSTDHESGSARVDHATKYIVGDNYFQTTGIPILRGRGFLKEDETTQVQYVVVSEAFAEKFWRGEDPLGRKIEISNRTTTDFSMWKGSSFDYRTAAGATDSYQIVGVAGDAMDSPMERPGPAIYFPMRPDSFARPTLQGVTLMIRTVPGTVALDAVRHEISLMDPKLTTFSARTMQDSIDQILVFVNIAIWSYGGIGAFGLILASVGLAGVTAYSVTRRKHEIGIRMALGARTSDVMRLIVGEGAVLITLGALLGLAVTWSALRMMVGTWDPVAQALNKSKSDPRIVLGALLILACVALAACYLPARKSVQIDPVDALRQE